MNKVKTTERLTKKERSLIWRRFYNSYGVSGGYVAMMYYPHQIFYGDWRHFLKSIMIMIKNVKNC